MKAMILAAGLGSRLGELTKTIPKCLIEVAGTPMLRKVSENLAKSGVSRVIINLHYHARQVEDFASNHLSDLFEEVQFSNEPELLGTGGGLKAAQPFFSGESNFLMVNADIYTNFQLSRLSKPLNSSTELLGCLAVMNRKDSSYLKFNNEGNFFGWLKADDGNLRSNPEVSAEKYSVHAFCGLQALSPKIFHYLEKEDRISFSIIDTYLQAARAGERINFCDISPDPWFDMGTPEQLEALKNHLIAG